MPLLLRPNRKKTGKSRAQIPIKNVKFGIANCDTKKLETHSFCLTGK